jgi:flagellar basal body P-ring protein FlgI
MEQNQGAIECTIGSMIDSRTIKRGNLLIATLSSVTKCEFLFHMHYA